MSRKEDIYLPALQGKKIPLLTLDNKWHRLFTQTESNDEIKKLEVELNDLIKLQGKYTTKCKRVRALKKKLMDEIVLLVEEFDKNRDAKVDKRIVDYQRIVNECNEEFKEMQERLLELPKEIDTVNKELMLLTMEICYEKIKDNSEQIEEINEWVTQIRIELKKNLIRKQEKEIWNQNLYAYMHDVFGAEVIEIFDMKYKMQEKGNNTPKTEQTGVTYALSGKQRGNETI